MPGEIQHYTSYPTHATAVCGAEMVGQRNTRRDGDSRLTTCRSCLEWIAVNFDFVMDREESELHGHYRDMALQHFLDTKVYT
mgnify:CR=1 FL=1